MWLLLLHIRGRLHKAEHFLTCWAPFESCVKGGSGPTKGQKVCAEEFFCLIMTKFTLKEFKNQLVYY